MSGFDPDAYLADEAGFDPDAYLAGDSAPRDGKPKVGPLRAAASGLGQAAFGLGDELGAGLQARLQAAKSLGLGAAFSPIPTGVLAEADPEVARVEREALRDNRMERDAAADQQAEVYYPTMIGGSLLMPAGGAAKGAKFLARQVPALVQGAAFGLGGSDADTLGGRLVDSAKGAGLGVGIGAALSGAGRAVSAAARKVIGPLRPSAAAQALRKAGVGDALTLGQMMPDSALAGIESAGAATPSFIGSGLKGQRDAGVEAWRKLVLNQARAPGQRPLVADDAAGALEKAYKGFRRSYDAVREVPVEARGLREALESAADSPGLFRTDAELSAVQRFLADQASGAEGLLAAKAGDLISARSGIRDAVRDAVRAGNMERARMLEAAEKELTRGLVAQLPEKAAARLAAADKAYSRYKVVEDAVRAAGDSPAGLMPSQLSSAVRRATERGQYARGGGGPLRALARAGRNVFEPRTASTGARIVGAFPGVDKVLQLGAFLANKPLPKKLILGETALQRGLAGVPRPRAPIAAALEANSQERRRRELARLLSENVNVP